MPQNVPDRERFVTCGPGGNSHGLRGADGESRMALRRPCAVPFRFKDGRRMPPCGEALLDWPARMDSCLLPCLPCSGDRRGGLQCLIVGF